MLVRTAIDRGAWPAFLIGLGSCIGDVIWACAGALGVSALLQWPPAAWVLWLGGSAILCWFAAAALRDAVRGASLLLIEGRLERTGDVANLVAERIAPLTAGRLGRRERVG